MTARLLVDQNISRKAVRLLEPIFPGSSHVIDVGLGTASDTAIWDFARERGFVILSKDSDFHHLSFLRGAPPKAIWLRIGNCRSQAIVELVRMRTDEIESFLAQSDAALLVLTDRL